MERKRQAEKAKREAIASEREERRRKVDAARAARARSIEHHHAEAETRTDAVVAQIAELNGLLRARARSLTSWSRQVEDALADGGPEAVAETVRRALATSPLPTSLSDGHRDVAYVPESRELFIRYELPRQDIVPTAAGYRYLQKQDIIRAEPRKDAEIKKIYGQLIARVVLRVLAESFDIAPPTLVQGIVADGYVSAKDRATGKPITPRLISVNATRDAFEEIHLDEPELDPEACLRSYLNAIVSPHPYDLEAVRPVVQFDHSKYKFIDEVDVVAGLDSRPNLLELTPGEFEHLVRRLFEAIGMKSWVTQASRDDGVDAVAFNEDPIVGGLCVIQAKKYSRIVGLEATHALAGVMNDKAAAKGVLVTTSWVGKASRDFAARTGRMEIIEGRHLKHMLREHLGIDALIPLSKVPPGWAPEDLT